VIKQSQTACATEIVSDPVMFSIEGSLIAQLLSSSVSIPDIPDGTAKIGDFSGGQPGYEIRADLISPEFAGQQYPSIWEPVYLNANLDYEHSFELMPAGRYNIEIKDQMGCVYELEVIIGVNTEIVVPNTFTPNNDGYNDVFFIRNKPPTGAKLLITNRWGNRVFKSDNYQNDWDAENVEDGLYFYSLEVNGEVYRGWLEIQRGPAPGN